MKMTKLSSQNPPLKALVSEVSEALGDERGKSLVADLMSKHPQDMGGGTVCLNIVEVKF